jgi:hypothetical protein
MRGIPDSNKEQHSNEEQPDAPLAFAVSAPTLIPKAPLSAGLAALGREVLDLVPRKQRDSLAAYRQAARDLSAILKVTGVRRTPKTLFYAALRVKWLMDNTSA